MGQRIYYHVTTKAKLPWIMKRGLIMEHRKNVPLSKRVNYVFSDKYEAYKFALRMQWYSTGHEQPIVVLKLRLNDKYIQPDLNTRAIQGAWWEYHKDIMPSQIIKIILIDAQFREDYRRMQDRIFKEHREVSICIR